MAAYRYYQVGGSLKYQHPTYVTRHADFELYEQLKNGELCYVLNSRQMGKSSLRVRMMKTLTSEGIKCASIDLGRLGKFVSCDNWFGGFIYELGRSFGLATKAENWWQQHKEFPSVLRLSRFVEEVLLVKFSENLVIFIDEIDNIINVDFKDDFFTFIYTCYNQRADIPEYGRLTFCLLGVATPFDLIEDKVNTYSNIGYGIELNGFKLESAKLPLARGLEEIVEDPERTLFEILDWTGGQPFLTQKLCQLVAQEKNRTPKLQQLVQTHIVERWEFQDEHEHFKTIRNRLLHREHLAIAMLTLYQKILQGTEIIADNSLEQMELRLSGLVVKQENCLRIYNKIYRTVFNFSWVEQTLSNLRPYTKDLAAWTASNDRNENYLLKDEQLKTALAWAADKSLSHLDYKFLAASQEFKKLEAEREAKEIFRLKTQQAEHQAKRIVKKAKQQAKRKIQQARKKILRNSSIFVLGASLIGVTISTGLIREARNRRKIEEIKTFNLMSENYLNENPHRQLEALLASVKAGKQLQQTVGESEELKAQTTSSLQRVIDKIEEFNRLEGHKGAVNSVSFSPDGKTIVSGGKDNTVKLWSREGQLLETFNKHQGEITNVSFSPDGKMIATASEDNTAKLWDLQGRLLKTLQEHIDTVYSVNFSPDSTKIVTASWDYTVKLWSRDGILLKTSQHRDRVWNVEYSPDGKKFATVSSDKTIKLWNYNNTLLGTLTGHLDRVRSLSFSPDSKTIATASEDGTIRIWKIDSNLPIIFQGHSDEVHSISFSPIEGIVATASRDKTAKLWDVRGRELATLKGHKERIWSVSFSPDGSKIATASWDGTIKVWTNRGKELKTLTGHNGRVYNLSFSPVAPIFASVGSDKIIIVWDSNNLNIKSKWTSQHQGKIVDVSFASNGQTIATASDDGTVELWTPTGTLLTTLKGHLDEVNSVSFSPNSKVVATASDDKTVKLWNLQGKELKTLTRHGDRVMNVTFASDGRSLATASLDGTVKLWHSNGTLLYTFSQYHDDNDWIWDVSFSSDGKYLAFTSQDNTVKFWQLNRTRQKLLDLNELLLLGCRWLEDYLRHNQTIETSDRHLCN